MVDERLICNLELQKNAVYGLLEKADKLVFIATYEKTIQTLNEDIIAVKTAKERKYIFYIEPADALLSIVADSEEQARQRLSRKHRNSSLQFVRMDGRRIYIS